MKSAENTQQNVQKSTDAEYRWRAIGALPNTLYL